LIAGLERVKNSLIATRWARCSKPAIAALDDVAYTEQTSNAIIASRAWLTAQLQALGFEVLPSQANFVFARHPQHDGAKLAKGCASTPSCAPLHRRPHRPVPAHLHRHRRRMRQAGGRAQADPPNPAPPDGRRAALGTSDMRMRTRWRRSSL
jgi:hypothetical protein